MKTVKGKVLDFIENMGKEGALAQEIYNTMPETSQRTIRYALLELLNSGLVKRDRTCRCHAAPIYEATSTKTLKTK